MTTKAEEITQFMLTTFGEQGWEDTPQNRLDFLTGLQMAWAEPDPEDEDLDSSQKLAKVLYRVTLNGLLSQAKVQVRFAVAR